MSIVDTTEECHFDMLQKEMSGALALCDGEDASCCSGVEVVVIDANRLSISISLYGRRVTVRDESGIISSKV